MPTDNRQRLAPTIDTLLAAEVPLPAARSEMMSEFSEHAIVHFEAEDTWLGGDHTRGKPSPWAHRSLVEIFSDVRFLTANFPRTLVRLRPDLPHRHLTEEDRKVVNFLSHAA